MKIKDLWQLFRSRIRRNRIVVANFGYLSILELVNLLIPLATYPYLIKTLGSEVFGTVIYAQVIVSYLLILVSFGFGMSATQQVSIHRDVPEKLNEIVSSVLFIKGSLFLLSVIILSSVLYFIPEGTTYKALFILSLWICLYDFIFPVWFYQGIEKMKYITFLTLTSRIIFFVLIFALIKSPEDYLKVPIINGIGSLIAGIISLYIVISTFKIRLSLPSVNAIKLQLKESYSLFLSEVVIAIKDKTNYLLIGSLLGHSAVTEFDLALKVKGVLSIPINLINKALYPKIAKEKNMPFMLKSMWLTLSFTTIITLAAMFLAHPITVLLGGKNMPYVVQVTRIILIAIPPFTVSYFLAVNCINANGRYVLLLKGMLYTSLFYLAVIALGYFTGNLKSLYFYAWCAVLTYVFELFYRVYITRKNKLI
ncbi:MAG: oligosaccharide flippase family protein [Bacteroidales bacterium]|nr:oligosaccharide flippase family protein [Bacteroidales bacterium]